MTIKNRGGVFGRNPTFNDVDVDGTLTVGGNAVPAANTILVDGDIGSTVQGFDADTAKLDVAQTFTQDQIFNTQIGVGVNPSSFNQIQDTGQSYAFGKGNGTPSLTMYSANNASGRIAFADGLTGNEQYRGWLEYDHSTDAMAMRTAATERFKITSTGNVEVKTGNLVISTSGNGIDFSATAGTGTSELFDDYEEGTWTPAFNGVTGGNQRGTYTKVGDLVTAYGYMEAGTATAVTASVSGLPFVAGTEKGAVHSWYNDWIPTSSGGWVFQSNTVILFTTDNSTSTQNAASGTKSCHFVAIYKT